MLCALYLEFSFFRKFFCYQLPGSPFFPVILLQFGHSFDLMCFKRQLCHFFLATEIHEKVLYGYLQNCHRFKGVGFALSIIKAAWQEKHLKYGNKKI